MNTGIQWRVARSAALVFLGVALAIGAALFLVRSSEPSAAAVSVQLGPDGDRTSSAAAESRGAGGGSAGSGDEGGDGEGVAASPSRTTPSTADPEEDVRDPARADGGDPASASVVVYVTGAVARPGVVTVMSGTRLVEMIDLVGGALPEADLEGINLASTPGDGAHIHVLAVGEEPRATLDGTASTPAGDHSADTADAGGTSPAAADPVAADPAVIDINTASLADIETLPRVGPVLAQRIIDWRTENGPFGRPSDLDAVPGIGPALLEGIVPRIVTR